jgi:tetratricopeptide (TPR) repeat protein
LLQKTLALFNRFEPGDHYHIGFISDYVRFFTFPFVSLWLILPLGMAGMMVSAYTSKKMLAVSDVFFLYALTLILFFTNTRYRLPLVVILIPCAVIGIESLACFLREKRFRAIAVYSSMVIAFFVIEFLPIRGADDMTPYYNTHAIILDEKGLKDQAIDYWERSSAMDKPASAFADLALAGKYLLKRDPGKAASYLDKIPESSFAAAAKYEIMGDMMLLSGRVEKAVSAYQRSLEINSGQRRPRIKLIRIYERIDRKRALQEKKGLRYISSFYTIF